MQPPKRQSRSFDPDYGPGKDFSTKEQFFNWKWSKPLKDRPVIKNKKIWHFCTKCNCWTFHPTTKCRHPDAYVKKRPNTEPHYQANIAKINNSNWGSGGTKWNQRAPDKGGWGQSSRTTKPNWGRSSKTRTPHVRDQRGDSEPPNNTYGLKDFE